MILLIIQGSFYDINRDNFAGLLDSGAFGTIDGLPLLVRIDIILPLVTDSTWVNGFVNGLWGSFIKSPDFRMRFMDRYSKHFGPGGAMSPQHRQWRWEQLYNMSNPLKQAIFNVVRWSSGCDIISDQHLTPLLCKNLPTNKWSSYHNGRDAVYNAQLSARGILPTLAAPAVSPSPTGFRGSLQVSLTGPAGAQVLRTFRLFSGFFSLHFLLFRFTIASMAVIPVHLVVPSMAPC